jgi:hypothetical protein
MEKQLQRALQLYAEAMGKSEEEILEMAIREYLSHNYEKVKDDFIRAKILRLLRGEGEEPVLTIEELGLTIPLMRASQIFRATLEEKGGQERYYDLMKAVLEELGLGYELPKEVIVLKNLHSSFFMVDRGVPSSLRGYLIFRSNGQFPALEGVYVIGALDRTQLNKGFYPILKYSYVILAKDQKDFLKKAFPLLRTLQEEMIKDV